ncbi:hypothetical protein C8Q78DRAFT_805725 [Trametes maxima]|nr:hypothetical protein C8Q78DRAFT_805725 [Trametes maxima]
MHQPSATLHKILLIAGPMRTSVGELLLFPTTTIACFFFSTTQMRGRHALIIHTVCSAPTSSGALFRSRVACAANRQVDRLPSEVSFDTCYIRCVHRGLARGAGQACRLLPKDADAELTTLLAAAQFPRDVTAVGYIAVGWHRLAAAFLAQGGQLGLYTPSLQHPLIILSPLNVLPNGHQRPHRNLEIPAMGILWYPQHGHQVS